MLQNYFPVLIFLAVGVVLGIAPMIISWLLSPRKPSLAKVLPYECGFEPFENARLKFDVRFYLIAILFIIFDLEIAFLFPWAVVLNKIGWPGFYAMGIFLGVLLIGFWYEWKKGALEWE